MATFNGSSKQIIQVSSGSPQMTPIQHALFAYRQPGKGDEAARCPSLMDLWQQQTVAQAYQLLINSRGKAAASRPSPKAIG